MYVHLEIDSRSSKSIVIATVEQSSHEILKLISIEEIINIKLFIPLAVFKEEEEEE